MGFFLPYVGHRHHRRGAWLTVPRIRTVTIHDPAEARAAVAAAARDGVRVTLISAPAAAASGGPEWFMALVESAMADMPQVEVTAILDCGDRPGDALAALRAGWRVIVYTGPASAKVRDIAGQFGAQVLRRRP